MRYRSRRLIHRTGLALALCWVSYPVIAATLPEVVGQGAAGTRTSRPARHCSMPQKNSSIRHAPVLSNRRPGCGGNGCHRHAIRRTAGAHQPHTDAYLRWNLFRGQADRQGVKTANSAGAADADREETHEQVALQVTETYLELLRLRPAGAGEEYNADLLRLSDTMQAEEAGRVWRRSGCA